MTYADYKAVYIDKTVTLKDWQSQRESANIDAEVKGITFETWKRSRKLNEPVTSVTDAETFAEFQTYWAENYNVNVSDELAKLDFKSVKAAANGIESVLEKFPMAAQFLTELGTTTRLGDVMSTSPTGQIGFNPSYFDSFDDLNDVILKDVDNGFRPKNTKISGYGAHEMGHILIRALIHKNGNDGDYNDWKRGISAFNIVWRAYLEAVKTKDGEGKAIRELKAEISKYAKTSSSETLAEAVSDYAANGESASVLSRKIWHLLIEELGQSAS